MDPQHPESFNHRTETLSTGRKYHFVDQLPEHYDHRRSLTLLCVHGFPDFWYGWRNQIGPWVRKGYRVVVPDMLGYGKTDKPEDPSEYSTKKLCADLTALLDFLGIRRAVLIGHDWGAFTAARFALWYPDMILALVIMSVPYTPPSRRYIPVEEVALLAPNLGYQADFADPATSSKVDAHLERFLSITFRPPSANENYMARGSLFKLLLISEEARGPSILDDLEFQYYVQEMKEGGMHGPLNYYRTARHRHEEEALAGLPSKLPDNLPVLFMWGTKDLTATPFVINKARGFIKKLQDVAYEGRGHWLLVEAKDEITERVVNWLHGLTSGPPFGKL